MTNWYWLRWLPAAAIVTVLLIGRGGEAVIGTLIAIQVLFLLLPDAAFLAGEWAGKRWGGSG